MLQNSSVAEETGMNEDWSAMLEEHSVRFLVLDPHSDGNLVKLFRSQPGWTVDFEDREAIIFIRAPDA